jgi:hypothetical protein
MQRQQLAATAAGFERAMIRRSSHAEACCIGRRCSPGLMTHHLRSPKFSMIVVDCEETGI